MGKSHEVHDQKLNGAQVDRRAGEEDRDRFDGLVDALVDRLGPRLEAAAERGVERALLADREGAGPPIPGMLTPEETKRLAAWVKENFTPEELRQLRQDKTMRRMLAGKTKRVFRDGAEKKLARLGQVGVIESAIADTDTGQTVSKP